MSDAASDAVVLLPCPFCGGEPWKNLAGKVICQGRFEGDHPTIMWPVAAWNTRLSAPPSREVELRAEVERLRDALEPFAELADNFVSEDNDDGNFCNPPLHEHQMRVRVGWLRAALSARTAGDGGSHDDR